MAEALTDRWRRQAEEYRRRAAECRNRAEQSDDEWVRQSLLETAESWMRLAVQAARRIAEVERQRGSDDAADEPPTDNSNDRA
jgi:hypothetical protein